MQVVIAGGHGQIALQLERLLTMRGDTAVGLIRNPEQAGDLASNGATAVVIDLEKATVDEVAAEVRGADAVVFAAGAGPGSGAARKDTVDRGAAALLADAAELAGVRRYLLVSAMNATTEPPADPDDVFQVYLAAKGQSEADLRRRDLDWTVLRPGALTNDAGSGTVRLARSVPRGRVSRDDVAAVLLALLDEPGTARLTLELVGGDVPVDDAVRRLAG
ncbi:NAD(P)H-binding protein [Jiangella sp. DSM 45060]|uniref:NAD(P)H-binding protein n=1 Tax=Jiangella sp. DSM 45060 TaxID=1798224 RepID=UPI00087CA23F|nr:NAD(P)H-binding protein [Jiangella sp. DSM 45060]SDT58476.1 Nucleoside-diphosphate-sugar epimerase [Jiangella sp. DSM 45060]